MNGESYLIALDAKLRALEGFISAISIHREIDANLIDVSTGYPRPGEKRKPHAPSL
jgi:hypothetical protein